MNLQSKEDRKPQEYNLPGVVKDLCKKARQIFTIEELRLLASGITILISVSYSIWYYIAAGLNQSLHQTAKPQRPLGLRFVGW